MRSILDARFSGSPVGVEIALRRFQSTPRRHATPPSLEATVFLLRIQLFVFKLYDGRH